MRKFLLMTKREIDFKVALTESSTGVTLTINGISVLGFFSEGKNCPFYIARLPNADDCGVRIETPKGYVHIKDA